MVEEKKSSAAKDLGIRAAKGTLIYTIGNVIGSLAVLLLLIILARLLNPPDFGLYAIAIAFYNILSGHFVFGTVMRKDIPQTKDTHKIAELISNGYAVALIISIAVALVAFLCSNYIAIAIYHNASLSGSLQLASLLVFLYALFNLTLAILVAIDKVKEGTLIYLLYAFIQLITSVGLVLAGYGIFGALVGLGIGLIIPSIIGLILIARHIRSEFVKPTKGIAKHLINFSVPVLVSNLATYVPPNLAILLLGVYSSSLIVGNYNAAFRFGNFVSVILVSISFVLLPAFAKAFSEKDLHSKIGKIYNSSIYYSLLLLLPVVIYVVSVSRPLLYLLFSSQYSLAPFYFIVIVLGSMVGIISTYAGNLIVGYGDTKRFMYYQLLAVVIQIALLFALTPLFGANGVLIALFVISQILMDLIFVYALRKQFSFSQQFSNLIKLVIPSLLLMVLLYYVTIFLHYSRWSLVTNFVGTIILFPPLVALFGGIRKDTLKFIKEIADNLRIGAVAAYFIKYTELFMRAEKETKQ